MDTFCDICFTYFRDRLAHEASDVHQRHVLQNSVGVNPEEYKLCEICYTYFRDRLAHEASEVHQRHVLQGSVGTNAIEDKLCEVCYTYFRDRLTHEASEVHQRHVRVGANTIEDKLCEICYTYFRNKVSHESSEVHRRHVLRQVGAGNVKGMVEVQSAAKNRLKTYWVSGLDEGSDLITFLNNIRLLVIEKIKYVLESSPVKINVLVKCNFSKEELTDERWFKTENVRIFETDNVDEIVEHLFAKLLKEKSEHQAKGSGWTLREISGLELRINKYRPLGGSTFIELPKRIYDTKSVINVKNNDIYCFKYAIYSKYMAETAPRYLCSRVIKYIKDKNFETKYDWNCIKYPVILRDISKFEIKNNISINVFGIDEKNNVYPLKVVDEELSDHRDLLYLVKENKSHYCWIKSFNKLLHSQITKNHNSIYVCKRCFCHFHTHEKLEIHRLDCMKNAPSKIIMPGDDEKLLKFKNVGRAMRVPAIVVADFESILPKVQHCCSNDEHSYTCAIEKHEIMSFCFLLICTNNLKFEPISYRGRDAAKVFMNWIKEVAELVQNMYQNTVQMIALTQEEKQAFESAKYCHLCGEELGADRVQDHCHLTGKFRAALHSQCNLKFKMPKFLPVFFHNLSGYDAHFIVPNLGYDNKEINCIANSEEKYISFSKSIGNNFSIRFVDTFRFMASTLSKLADNLPREKFIHTKRVYGDKLNLVTRKGIFPYEYVDSWEKLEEKCLPPKEKFYSHINGETVSDDDYEFAQKIWFEFNCQTLGEYSDLYLKTDVTILSDIFENFRDVCMETYKLDPAWYYTSPGLAFDAMLKHTGVTLELMTDYDMLLMTENGIRGGISQCCKRYSKANNKYMREYDASIPNRYLLYLDANNLYGWAMSQPLPRGSFKWLSEEEIREFNLNISDDNPKGYFLEVDLDYPDNIHETHSDLPFCPENKIPPTGKFRKLLTTLEPKEKYVIHYVNLKQALRYGLKLNRIRRVIEFDQSRWLDPYININTEKRKLAKNDFDRDFFKLMVNSVFGKLMENLRRRIDLELVCNEKRLNKLIYSSRFLDRTIFSENLVAVHSRMSTIKMVKPIYAGQAVLDLSKTLIYLETKELVHEIRAAAASSGLFAEGEQ
ncbi:uncharacterized protein LOC124157025 [Ischnura elegans]|uniref:uncharacterized protein LOC124157025 n=1 Tax=Ischnura elegans TaxID=197161 RepID=UPI001ED87406|nr:uncharacterized protein LOC124157025 [Ischnura elegans]